MTNKSNRQLSTFKGGLSLQTCKELSNYKESLITPLPDKIILPLKQHIGIPSIPLVKKGESVLKGQKIAEANGYVSVPIHSSTSGKILAIDANYQSLDQSTIQTCIVIEPDGNDAWFDIKAVDDYQSVDPERLQYLIREAGIVGMGGAGFPAFVKLSEGTTTSVDTLIINGVECEPYISCDDRLIREKANYIVSGARMLRHAIQAKYCIIAVEEDMPEAFEALNKFIDDDIELVAVPTRYPAGGEKQLIKILTGREVLSGRLPINIGIMIHNVGTAAAAYRAVTRGEPLLSRYITVSGHVEESRNLQVLLGTPVQHCLKQVGYQEHTDDIIIMGGPMMGKRINDILTPVIKTTNSILVLPEKDQTEEMPCIKCGQCINVCPANLLPQELFAYAHIKNIKKTRALHLFDCIECGCCAYVCPSHIPLVEYYRQAKKDIADDEKRQGKHEHTEKRFKSRNQRLSHIDNRFNTKNIVSSQQDSDQTVDSITDKQTYIRAATERIKQKRSKKKNE